jgi:hypothetical protein
MSLLFRFRAEVPLHISPHAEGPFDAGIHDHSAERSVVRPFRALFARVPMRVPWRQTLLLQQANVPGPAGGPAGGPGGYLTRPVSPAGPICVEYPASVEHVGNWDCHKFPHKPDHPR